MTFAEEYEAIRTRAAIASLSPRGQIAVSGRDRASYLHGLLTNDIQALEAGTGCYAAWLTPQGRMLTDLHVFEAGDMMLVDVPADLVQATIQRLDQFLFSEDVRLGDMSDTLRAVWLHGPRSPAILDAVLTLRPGSGSPGASRGVSGANGFGSWTEYQNQRVAFGDAAVVAARVTQLEVPGYCLYIERDHAVSLTRALAAAGAVLPSQAAIEAARIEAGYPLFGVDMNEDTIPLEAGIEDRAISFTKGCYVGQEVIIRVMHRGHGRVAKKLVGLRIDGDVPGPHARIFSGTREVGGVTSAARSPVRGAIALGYVHRDFVTPETAVQVETGDTRAPAIVTARPMPAAV